MESSCGRKQATMCGMWKRQTAARWVSLLLSPPPLPFSPSPVVCRAGVFPFAHWGISMLAGPRCLGTSCRQAHALLAHGPLSLSLLFPCLHGWRGPYLGYFFFLSRTSTMRNRGPLNAQAPEWAPDRGYLGPGRAPPTLSVQRAVVGSLLGSLCPSPRSQGEHQPRAERDVKDKRRERARRGPRQAGNNKKETKLGGARLPRRGNGAAGPPAVSPSVPLFSACRTTVQGTESVTLPLNSPGGRSTLAVHGQARQQVGSR